MIALFTWWQSKFPQFFDRGRFIEDLVHDVHFKKIGHLDANDIAKNFETIDNFKPSLNPNWKFVDDGIAETIECETAVSIKSTKDTDLDTWLNREYGPTGSKVKRNLENI